MAVTININGLSLCHKGSDGVIKNTTPDVCKTPPNAVPKPFNITAYSKDLVNGTTSIKADGGNMAANLGSLFSTCTGDEGGSLGGLKSGTFKGKSGWKSYSPNVFLEGKAACRLTDQMWMNNYNCLAMAGLSQASLTDPREKVLCEIFCEVRAKGHAAKKKNPGKRFNYSSEAKKLSESRKYKGQISKAFGKGKFVAEKTMTGLVKKGALGTTGRKLMSKAALSRRLAKELGEQAVKKVAKKAAGKLFLKLIPGINIISTAYDVASIAMAVSDVAGQVDNILSKYDAFRIRPDVASVGPDGAIEKIYDYKFDYPSGSSDSMSEAQKKLYKSKTGKSPVEIDNNKCKCK